MNLHALQYHLNFSILIFKKIIFLERNWRNCYLRRLKLLFILEWRIVNQGETISKSNFGNKKSSSQNTSIVTSLFTLFLQSLQHSSEVSFSSTKQGHFSVHSNMHPLLSTSSLCMQSSTLFIVEQPSAFIASTLQILIVPIFSPVTHVFSWSKGYPRSFMALPSHVCINIGYTLPLFLGVGEDQWLKGSEWNVLFDASIRGWKQWKLTASKIRLPGNFFCNCQT